MNTVIKRRASASFKQASNAIRRLEKIVRNVFPLTPKGIIDYLKLRRPIFCKTAAGGHFGRKDPEFLWEKLNKIEELKKATK